jgi:thiamine pyrophosphate-dependent acetolactate synthase large subunit-like protein
MTTKVFPTGDVLSIATGVLVTPNGIGAVYEVLDWMTGERVYTHQSPRISREAGPVLLAAHPELAEAYAEAEQVTPENWQQWLATWVARYGETIEVPKFTADQHERIDPISELAEVVPPDRIIVANTGRIAPREPTG